jgi:hypothetical protein
VDCKYHWKKAQWGVLGSERMPAGIVYMDITFKQPKGYWLDRASVFVTVSEDMSTYAIAAPHRSGTATSRSLTSDHAVQITDHYGPRILTGAKTALVETKHDKFIPSVGVMGFELGGIGHESTTTKHRVGRWVFKGSLGRPKGCHGLQTLEWELSENELNPEQAHSQAYQTAFAFEHSERPVYMRVEVQGKLRSQSRQMVHKMLRFSSAFGKNDDSSTLTELDLGKHLEFRGSLDQVAQGLNMAMQMANCEGPLEVPDPTPAQFTPQASPYPVPDLPPAQFSTQAIPSPLPHSTLRPPLQQGPTAEQWTQRPALQQPPPSEQWSPGGSTIQGLSERLESQCHECRDPQNSAADPVAESLRRQLRGRLGNDIPACIHTEEERRDSEAMSNEDTLVNSESGSGRIVASPVAPGKGTGSPVKPGKGRAMPLDDIDQHVLDIMKIPALLMLLRFVATMLQWLSRPEVVRSVPTQKVVSGPDQQEPMDDNRRLEESTVRGRGEQADRYRSPVIDPLPSLQAVALKDLQVSGRRGVQGGLASSVYDF